MPVLDLGIQYPHIDQNDRSMIVKKLPVHKTGMLNSVRWTELGLPKIGVQTFNQNAAMKYNRRSCPHELSDVWNEID